MPDRVPARAARSQRQQPRLGLCCTFLDAPIKFRFSTARYLESLAPKARWAFVGELCLHNAVALEQAVTWCAQNDVGAFRIFNQIFPLYTHPTVGYRWTDLPTAGAIESAFGRVRSLAASADVRLSFHPDQFVVLGSTSPAVVKASVRELDYLAEVSDLVGGTQLTIHGGGATDGKPAALARLRRGLDRLSDRARRLVALENDDRVYTVRDLLPVCAADDVRMIYDVHHHRCLPDDLDVAEATEAATETWKGAEPWFHLSSPAKGWRGSDPRPHHDLITLRDFPAVWRKRRITIDVEAKAKESAVLALSRALARKS
ncbi:MAG TPA: UV DNA damage repair endonuclease UvsE [Polyangia bacterium]